MLSAVLCIIVRQYKPEMALGISIACGVLIMGAVIAMLAPSVELISQLTGAAGLDGGYSRTLFKALAVCYKLGWVPTAARTRGNPPSPGR